MERYRTTLIACGLLVSAICIAEVHGTVKAMSGEPVTGAVVFHGLVSNATTDDQGRYVLPKAKAPTVVIALGRGFHPATALLSGDGTTAEFVLVPESEWRVPPCEGRKGTFGHYLKLPRPSRMKTVRGRDVDYEGAAISFRDKETRKQYWLTVLWGGMAYAGRPAENKYFQARSFATRLWVSGETIGLDVSGIDADSTRWRTVGPLYGGSVAWYEGVSEEAARFFDAVMDGMCWDGSAAAHTGQSGERQRELKLATGN
ncbi:MAG TPA: carboxypeptidase-like regulatory domain-containing protein [Terriglobales bacterium]|nr:carboxypeptidase-like regulatory domain-containing protein [Terriglobales bacterium]